MLVGGPVVLGYVGTPVIHEVGLEVDVAKDAPELLHGEHLKLRAPFVRPPIVVLLDFVPLLTWYFWVAVRF